MKTRSKWKGALVLILALVLIMSCMFLATAAPTESVAGGIAAASALTVVAGVVVLTDEALREDMGKVCRTSLQGARSIWGFASHGGNVTALILVEGADRGCRSLARLTSDLRGGRLTGTDGAGNAWPRRVTKFPH